MILPDKPHKTASYRNSRATLLIAAVALGTVEARAQTTCVGTDDIVCTNSGTVAFMGDPPSGPLGGTTSLTNINTATGVAGGIQTTANRGDATTVNYGTVNGNVGANTGDFGQDALRNATVYNYGTVNGIIRAITYFSGDATIVNTGVATALVASVNASGFGSAKIYNSGTVRNISASAASTFFGQTLVVNSGTVTGLIANYNPVKYVLDDSIFGFRLDTENPAALTINTGTAGTIFTRTDSGALVRSINYGTVGEIVTNGATTAEFGNAESINYGHAGNISTTTGAFTGTATTRNEAGGVAGDLSSSAINFADAVTINHGVAKNLTSAATDGSADIINSGIAATVSATSDNHTASIVNSGTIRGVAKLTAGYAGSAGPGSFLTNSGLIDGSGQYAAIDITANAPGGRTALNLLPGSRIVGAILLTCDPTAPTAINITSKARTGSSVLTFGDTDGTCGLGDGSPVTVSNAIYVVGGNSIAIVDPSSFAVASRNVVDVTGAIQSLAAGRLANPVPAPTGGQATGFASSGNFAHGMANDAFAAIPGLTPAGQDRALLGNPTFTAADGTSVWAQGFGGRRIAPEDGPVLRSVNSFYGGALGIDRMVQPRLRLGAYIGGGGANAANRRVDNNLAANGIETAWSSYASWFVSPELAFGIARPLGGNLTLTPTVRLRYLAAGFGGYQESGSVADMTVNSRLAHYIEERGGIAISHVLAGVAQGRLQTIATAGISALQRAGDSNVNAVLLGQSLAFAVPGQGSLTGFYAGASIDWRHVSGATLFAATEFNTTADASRSITGRGGLRFAF